MGRWTTSRSASAAVYGGVVVCSRASEEAEVWKLRPKKTAVTDDSEWLTEMEGARGELRMAREGGERWLVGLAILMETVV